MVATILLIMHLIASIPLQNNIYSELNNNPGMEQVQDKKVKDFAKSIQWFGQATVKFVYNDKTIYIDPYQLKKQDKADIILITHDHMDHLSLPDIAKIAYKKTQFVVAGACEEKLKNGGYTNIRTVKPGETVLFPGIIIKTVPAYNISKNYHKKSSQYLGFVIDFGGVKVYHTGDTERIPEMKQIRCDIIMLPVGQTYTMNSVDEAVEVVLDTKAKIAIPIHYGLYEGTKEDAVKFKEMLNKKNVEVLLGN